MFECHTMCDIFHQFTFPTPNFPVSPQLPHCLPLGKTSYHSHSPHPFLDTIDGNLVTVGYHVYHFIAFQHTILVQSYHFKYHFHCDLVCLNCNGPQFVESFLSWSGPSGQYSINIVSLLYPTNSDHSVFIFLTHFTQHNTAHII